MEKKIFFIDFDGTLMRDDKTISDVYKRQVVTVTASMAPESIPNSVR